MCVLGLCDWCCLAVAFSFGAESQLKVTESQLPSFEIIKKKSSLCFQISFDVTAIREAECCESALGPPAAYPVQFAVGFQPFCRPSELISVLIGNPWLDLTPESYLAFIFIAHTVACSSG